MSNFIRVLRNGTIYSSRDAAKTALQAQLAKLQDGEICLASYSTVTPSSWEGAKTILGVVRLKDGVRSYTIFDNEDIAGIVAKIEELNANKTSTGDSHVTVNVVEEKGVITAVNVTTSDIASAAILGTKNDASTVDTAFGRIQKEVEDRAKAITDAIALLDSEVHATAAVDEKVYSVLTGVKQVDGKLTEKTEVTLAAVAKTGLAEDVANAAIVGGESQVAVNGTNVKDQISSIATTLKGVQNSIANVEKNALKYRTVKLSEAEVTALSDSNVKEAYQVVSYTGEWVDGTTTGTKVGDVIKIYKDSSVKEIYLGSVNDTIEANGTFHKVEEKIPEADLSLNYAYMKADGTYAMTSIPVGSFLRESEFKDGLQVNNGEVSVKVDTTSEGFLTVGKDGVKVSGVQTAINTAIQALHATVESTGDEHVTVNLTEENGVVTGVTVSTTGLALDSQVIKGVTVNGADAQVSADRKAIVTINGANTAVSNAYVATKYADKFDEKVTEGNYHIAAGDTIDAALKKAENTISVLATEVISNEKVTTAAITELAKSTGVTNTDGVIKYTPDTNTTYLKTAASVHDATVKLDAAITTVDGKITALGNEALKSLNGSNAITVSGDTANSKTVSLKLDTTIAADAVGANALAVNANGLYLSNVWDCGEY